MKRFDSCSIRKQNTVRLGGTHNSNMAAAWTRGDLWLANGRAYLSFYDIYGPYNVPNFPDGKQ